MGCWISRAPDLFAWSLRAVSRHSSDRYQIRKFNHQMSHLPYKVMPISSYCGPHNFPARNWRWHWSNPGSVNAIKASCSPSTRSSSRSVNRINCCWHLPIRTRPTIHLFTKLGNTSMPMVPSLKATSPRGSILFLALVLYMNSPMINVP